MTKQKGFTQEFEDEAVRLARTSGRTRRELAENLGVGLSTLTRWIARNRDRQIDAPEKARGLHTSRYGRRRPASPRRADIWPVHQCVALAEIRHGGRISAGQDNGLPDRHSDARLCIVFVRSFYRK